MRAEQIVHICVSKFNSDLLFKNRNNLEVMHTRSLDVELNLLHKYHKYS